MSPQDSQMLHDFLSQLIQARGIQKDPEADALIQRAVAQQPDAAYLLVQRALLLEQALNNAKDRIAGLESQLQQARSGQQGGDGKFLDANSWGNSGRTQPSQSYQRDTQQPYQTQPPYQPQYQPQYQSAPSSGFLRGGLGGTLGSIAATAAGVAAGGFLFQGLENMFSHHDHGGGNRLLNSDDPSNNLFSDQSGSSLADQAGLGDVDRVLDDGPSEGLFDSSVDNGSLDGGQGFFDGDGSDEGLFS
ncbi:DUF2076 domain-containing protein [Massilia putida]|uniref:DUF2076 domain-containing protein n=1 Tax=Massilia putida TaxID=1141883 RepID=UPI0009516B7F|nr:DUF2076 family protein [Massilia putida]